MLDERKESLQEEREEIEKQKEAIEKYYDQLIESTQKYYDQMIEALEKQKSKWEELQEIETITKAYKDLGDVAKTLGFSAEDLLNDTPGAFEAFKDAYIGVLLDMNNGNADFISGLNEWSSQTGQAVDGALGKWNTFGDGYTNVLNQMTTAASSVGNLVEPLNELATQVEGVQKLLETGFEFKVDENGLATLKSLPQIIEDAGGGIKEATKAIPEGVSATLDADTTAQASADEFGRKIVGEAGGSGYGKGIEKGTPSESTKRATEAIPEAVVAVLGTDATAQEAAKSFGERIVNALKESLLTGLTDAMAEVATSLGADTENSIFAAIDSLNAISLEDGIIAQFNALLDVINAVTNAIGGGGVTGAPSGESQSSGQGSGEGQEGSVSSSVTGAIEALHNAADKHIGTSAGGGEDGENKEGGEGGDSEGTVIGDFTALEGQVKNTSTAIGTSESEEDSADLIGSVKSLGKTDAEVMHGGESGDGLLADWAAFNAQLREAEDHITKMAKGLENLEESYETTLTVTLEIKGGPLAFEGTAKVGNRSGYYSLNILDAIGLPSEGGMWVNELLSSKAGKAKLTGTANFGGNWGYEGGKTMIAELGPEIVVLPNGTYRVFDKPQIVDLPKNSVIFNHLQSQEILDTKNQISARGKAHLNGTLPAGANLLSSADPQTFASFMELGQMLLANTDATRNIVSNVDKTTQDINRSIQTVVNNNDNGVNISFGDLNFTCTGVTSDQVLREVNTKLESTFSGLALNAYQRSMAR